MRAEPPKSDPALLSEASTEAPECENSCGMGFIAATSGDWSGWHHHGTGDGEAGDHELAEAIAHGSLLRA
jgi:hypothetical protein